MSYTAPTAQISAVMDKAANALYLRGAGSTQDAPAYSTLSLTQKTALVDAYTRDIFINLARQFDSDQQAEVARLTALNASKTGYGLG
jgi:hypothetical protein